MDGLLQEMVKPGPMHGTRALLRFLVRRLLLVRSLAAPTYQPPSSEELAQIERQFEAMGMMCADFRVEPEAFDTFKQLIQFPPQYHGGQLGGVFEEKLLEHYVAWELLGLGKPGSTPYVDIAACASPWAKLLRDQGAEAYAIDLVIDPDFENLEYYRGEDATSSNFANASVGSASLQCAFEMFVGDHDVALIAELARILMPGGRAVISPLYVHTHACHYQTPEYFGRFTGDCGAKSYVRRDCWGVPSSRKYDAQTLRHRIWDSALRAGLEPSLKVLRNKREIGDAIYLHFILVLDKPPSSGSILPEVRQ